MAEPKFWAPGAAYSIIMRLEQAGFAAYLVGGAVRDEAAGRIPHDCDLCTSARPEQVRKLFSDCRVLETGLRHGTVTVLMDGAPFEITTFRTEDGYSDGRHPDEVQFVTEIEADLSRRDFTVNAMAWSPVRGLCDPFGGMEDLRRGILRCVGDPVQRLTEDALRILRALRFRAERGLHLEPQTERALKQYCPLLKQISAERITSELLRILCGAYAGRVLMEYPEIFVQIMPELAPMVGFDQHNYHHRYDVWEHSVRALEGIRPEPELRFAMLLHDCGKPASFSRDEKGTGHFYDHPKRSYEIAKPLLSRLRLDNRMYDEILYLVRHHDEPLGITHRSVRRKLSVHGEARFRRLLAVKKADCIGQGTAPENLTALLYTEQLLREVLNRQNCLSVKDLAVNGYDLMAWGLKGREIGYCLGELLQCVLDNPSCNTPEQLRAIFESRSPNRMELTVTGMSAKFCANRVCALLNQMDGVVGVQAELPSGRVIVEGSGLDRERIRERLSEAGYEVVIG